MTFLDKSMPAQQLPAARVNWTHVGLIILAMGTAAVCLTWARKADVIDEHRHVRQLILHYTLSRTEDPVIVLGDSIVEASTLPRSVCGHAIVNAGIGGASTVSGLGSMLSLSLGGKRAALVVVSLGTNDAAIPHSVERY